AVSSMRSTPYTFPVFGGSGPARSHRLPTLERGGYPVGGVHFAEAGEGHLDAVVVRVEVGIGHRVTGECDVVSVVVCGPGRTFDAEAGSHAAEDDTSDASAAQVQVEIRAVEGAGLVLG